MSISPEREDMCNIDTVIFQEVTQITFYGTKYGAYYRHTFCFFPTTWEGLTAFDFFFGFLWGGIHLEILMNEQISWFNTLTYITSELLEYTFWWLLYILFHSLTFKVPDLCSQTYRLLNLCFVHFRVYENPSFCFFIIAPVWMAIFSMDRWMC